MPETFTPKVILSIVIAIVVFVIAVAAFLSSRASANAFQYNVFSKTEIGAVLAKSKRIISPYETPSTTMTCKSLGDGYYNYNVKIVLDAIFKGSPEIESMRVMPVIYFRGDKKLNRDPAKQEFALTPSTAGQIVLENDFTMPFPPVKYVARNSYLGPVQLNQKLVIGSFSFKLVGLNTLKMHPSDFDPRIPDIGRTEELKRCHVIVSIECANDTDAANLYLPEEDKTCNLQYDNTRCFKSYFLCGEDTSIELSGFDRLDVECDERMPVFSIISKGKLDRNLGDVIDIAFWKTYEKTDTGEKNTLEKAQECWERDLTIQMTSDCEEIFLGGFSVSSGVYGCS